ncbi:MAG: GLPGLI family protein [Chitinophagia bacterium]
MRKIFLALTVFLVAITSAFAQVKEGKLIFERKINMYRMITDPEMRARIPEFRTEKFELLFNEQASMFKTIPEEDAPDPFANSGGGGGERGGRFNFRMPETATYTDIPNQMQYEARSLFEKDFLIVDSLKPINWKLSEETKTIAKFVCKKATTMITPQQMNMRFGGGGGRNRNTTDTAAPAKPKEEELVVWYTESIPVSVGPDAYAGLPGAILEVNSSNGGNVITASEFTAKYAAKELKQPTKGDKMNRAQFAESMKKIMEDMQRGGGMGGMRIRINQ